MRAPSLIRALALLVGGVALCAPLVALPARAGGGSGRPVAPPPPPPPPLPGPGREAVTITTSDGLTIAATYSQGGRTPPEPGGAALLLVHEEGTSRLAFAALVGRLDAHHVPWLAIDLRGHGKSSEQAGVDLATPARARDPTVFAGAAEDTYAALRWLVDVRKHDPKRIGILGAGLGASATIRVAHLHKGEMTAVMLLTPALDFPGYDTTADMHDIDGYMDFEILASVEDMNRLGKLGPRRIIYSVQADRNAPKGTPIDERIKHRRGIPPRVRAFADTGVYATKMLGKVAYLDAWVAAWWARRLGTFPHAVLYDGSVDAKGDYGDPEWAAGVAIPTGQTAPARALRWGRRMMVGAELPKGVRAIYLRIHSSRGDRFQGGQYARIAFPSGEITGEPLVRGPIGRVPPTQTTALTLEGEEIPTDNGIEYGNPSFEAEVTLPDIPGDGSYVVHVSVAVSLGGEAPTVVGVDPDDPLTWTVVPDFFPPEPYRDPEGREEK